MTLRRSGRELDLFPPGRLSWEIAEPPGASGAGPGASEAGRSEAETLTCEYRPVPGVTLRFWRQGPADAPAAGWIEVDGEGVAAGTEVEIELYPKRFEGAPVWGRLDAPRVPGVVFLARGRSGGRLADTVMDEGTGWAFQLSGSAPGLSWESAEGAGSGKAGFRIRFEALASPAAARLQWRYCRPLGPAFSARALRGELPPRGTSGWELHPDALDMDEASILRLARELIRYNPSDSLRVFEFGRGWREKVGAGRPRAARNPEHADSPGPVPPRSFPEGLAPVVSTLSVQGYRVGLWMAPFGSDDPEELQRAPERFIRDLRRGEPIARGLTEGAPSAFPPHVYDPTSDAGWRAIRERVATTLRTQGEALRILRLGGLGELASCYERYAPLLMRSRGAGASRLASRSGRDEIAREAFRAALAAVRAAAGKRRVLAGDAGTPAWAAGMLDACRATLLPRDGGDLLRLQALAALRDLPYHGLSWQGEGLLLDLGAGGRAGGLDAAGARRAFLDLQALTGRSMRLEPVSFLRIAARAEAGRRDEFEALRAELRRSSSGGACRALDLGASDVVPGELPPVWCVTGREPDGRARDLVGIFNFDPFGPRRVKLSLADLCWRASSRRRGALVFDLEAERVLGSVREGSFDFLLPPRSSRLIAVLELPRRPTVIASSLWKVPGERRDLEESWDEAAGVLEVTRRAPERRPPTSVERIHVLAPASSWRLVETRVSEGSLRTESRGLHHILEASAAALSRSPLRLRLKFRAGPGSGRSGGGERPEPAPGVVTAAGHAGTGGVWIEWDGIATWEAGGARSYEVFVDGRLAGRTFDTRFLHLPEPPFSPGTRHSIAVRVVSDADERERRMTATTYREPPIEDARLSDLSPLRIEEAWGFPGKDQAADGSPLETDPLVAAGSHGGGDSGRGLGVAIPSSVEYDLRGRFERFTARAGIDRNADLWSRARFRVDLDGEEIYASPIVSFGDRAVGVDLAVGGGRRLVLRVERSGPDVERPVRAPLAFWRDARLEARRTGEPGGGGPSEDRERRRNPGGKKRAPAHRKGRPGS